MAGKNDDFTCDIIETLGVLHTSAKGWTKELNRVSWNGDDPKFDLREWSPDHEKCSKGATFTEEEGREIAKMLVKYFEENE
jgi:hypothetical protein